jgi:2-polyprenyl-3-methyl-5-hydroxy-6-metoxy-1,4-benzoquinol methylase
VDPLRSRGRAENERLLRGLVEIEGQSASSGSHEVKSYDDLHAEGYLRQRDSFYKWLLGLLQARPGDRLLDVSCGQGLLLHFAAEQGLRVDGIDVSPWAVGATARRLPGAGAAVADAERLPYPGGTFDYITNIGSVEHYARPHQAVGEMARVLKQEGLALILVPNTFGLLGNILYAWRAGDVFDDGQPLQRYGTRAQWARLFEMNGLRVVRVHKFERALPRTWRDLGWYARRPHKLLRACLGPLIPLNLASFLVYECQRADA